MRLVYMTAVALYRMTRPPYVLNGLGLWLGYVWSMITRKPRFDAPGFRRFLRRYQWSALLRGKSRALRDLEEHLACRWQAGSPPSPPPTG